MTAKEDKRFLKGEIVLSAVMNYLMGRYDRPDEIVANVLSQGSSLPLATSDDIMKTNILVLLSIKRDLSKYGQVAKIDSYYIAQIRLRVLTEAEHKRYMREKADYDEQKALAEEHAAKLKRTKARDPISSTHVPAGHDDLDAVAAARHIDVEEDDDLTLLDPASEISQ